MIAKRNIYLIIIYFAIFSYIILLSFLGFHLSATVQPQSNLSQQKGSCKVAILFDRRRISQCTCTCNSSAYWCSHV